MQFILGNLQSEFSALIQEINSYEVCSISSMNDLKSGSVISEVILTCMNREDLFIGIQGFSRENILNRWKVILDFMKIHFKLDLSEYLPDEVQNDTGVLFIVCKMICKAIKRGKLRSAGIFKTFIYQESEIFFEIEEEKSVIHQWLTDLKIIPPGLTMHEFLYRVRSGISLFEVIKKINFEKGKTVNISMRPKSIAECIKNINFLLRFLRNNTTVNRRFLYSSDRILEGNQHIIYGLLSDIKDFYLKKKTSLKTATGSCEGAQVTKYKSSSKNLIIEWLSSLGMLSSVIFSDNLIENTLKNGTLLCEVIQKVFDTQLRFNKNIKSFEDCQNNKKIALMYLSQIPDFKLEFDITKISEESAWEILGEIMKNCKGNSQKIKNFQNLEKKILDWMIEDNLISQSVKSVFDIIGLVQSGSLLARIANKYFKQNVSEKGKSFEVIKRSLKSFKSHPEMSQKFTQSPLEISRGEVVIIIGLLEDLYNFKQKFSQSQPSISQFKEFQQIQDIEKWMTNKDITFSSISGAILNDFKDGIKICEIIEKVCFSKIGDLINAPKTNSQALWNIRKGLETLYSLHEFPVKYKYYDDLFIAGDGKTIRSFLTDLIKL